MLSRLLPGKYVTRKNKVEDKSKENDLKIKLYSNKRKCSLQNCIQGLDHMRLFLEVKLSAKRPALFNMTEKSLCRLVSELRKKGMLEILFFLPNHYPLSNSLR
jgi:hypothetical protein